MSKETGGFAFPNAGGQKFKSGNEVRLTLPCSRMTLRDYFAATALNMCSACYSKEDLATWDYHHFSEYAYKIADAMLAERAKCANL